MFVLFKKNTLKVVVVWTNGKREGRDFTAASSLAIVLADCRWLANNHHHVTFYDVNVQCAAAK